MTKILSYFREAQCGHAIHDILLAIKRKLSPDGLHQKIVWRRVVTTEMSVCRAWCEDSPPEQTAEDVYGADALEVAPAASEMLLPLRACDPTAASPSLDNLVAPGRQKRLQQEQRREVKRRKLLNVTSDTLVTQVAPSPLVAVGQLLAPMAENLLKLWKIYFRLT